MKILVVIVIMLQVFFLHFFYLVTFQTEPFIQSIEVSLFWISMLRDIYSFKLIYSCDTAYAFFPLNWSIRFSLTQFITTKQFITLNQKFYSLCHCDIISWWNLKDSDLIYILFLIKALISMLDKLKQLLEHQVMINHRNSRYSF